MNPYGDGSNGSLNVTSGSYSLALDTKHQFTDVTIASGATLTTGSTTGSVLYILCTGTFTLDGTINVSGKVTYGNNSWSVTLDDVLYTSPGVANGGSGGSPSGMGGSQSNGYGGGGGGGGTSSMSEIGAGGSGGTGSSSFGSAGSGGYASTSTPNDADTATGGNSSGSAGGGGGAVAGYETSGDRRLSVWAQAGRGGTSYGANGSDGGDGGYTSLSGTSSATWYSDRAGGGGAGGRAGRAGVHVVIKARELIINGSIITSGTAGQRGGRGGRRLTHTGWFSYGGGGGGGGGGGNAGSIYLTYDDSLTNNGVLTYAGGAAGAAGGSWNGNTQTTTYGGGTGSAGTSGSLETNRLIDIESGGDGGGTATPFIETATIDITSGGSGGGRATYVTTYQTLPQKEYEYRVFDSDGNFIGIWKDVESDFEYSQGINETPTELRVDIARSPDNRKVVYDYLKDETNANILDNNSDPIFLQTETANAVGPDTDVDLNYNVDVYAFYGGYESLLDENGEEILDENSSQILTQFGAPNGVRVYSGYVADYELSYGDNTGVRVIVAPHATEMSHYVYKSGTTTTIAHNSTDPVSMARLAMDNYQSQGGIITYDTASMPLSGTTSSYTFKLQTAREVIDKSIELLPSGYYHFTHPGENKQYLLQKSASADHTFYYEKHISELNLRKSITQLVNKVYFVGGDTGSGDLYKYYEDATSYGSYRPGLKRLADSRVTLTASADALSEREIEIYAEPRYRTSVTISDAVYDIETITLGDMVAFKNFGTFVDDLLLQIVNITKRKHDVTLDLDMIVPNDTKRLLELKKNLQSEEVRNIPSAPS